MIVKAMAKVTKIIEILLEQVVTVIVIFNTLTTNKIQLKMILTIVIAAFDAIQYHQHHFYHCQHHHHQHHHCRHHQQMLTPIKLYQIQLVNIPLPQQKQQSLPQPQLQLQLQPPSATITILILKSVLQIINGNVDVPWMMR